MLQHFNPDLPSALSTDTSDFAIAGVLHQPDDLGLLHPIAYFSRKLSPAEINYEVYDKELLAIVESFRSMRAWLIGTVPSVSVISDHKNLEYFMTSRVLNRHQARWSMFLSEFNFRLDYAPGLKNPADAPSRHVDFAPRKGDDTLRENKKVMLMPLHTERIRASSSSTTPQVQILASTTLSLIDSDFHECYQHALQVNNEWQEAIKREDKDFTVQGNQVLYPSGKTAFRN